MVETYRRKIQTKDPPLATYVQAVKSVGDWIIEGYKAKIVPPSAGADALVVRDYTDTEDRIVLTEDEKIKFTDVILKRVAPEFLEIRNIADTAPRHLRLDRLEPMVIKYVSSTGLFQTIGASTAYIVFQSHNGTAFVDCAKLIGGWLEIAKGKLTGDLEGNKRCIHSIETLDGIYGDGDFYILARRTPAYAGDALFLQSYDSVGSRADRLVITGGVDIAEIKIANSKLNLQSNKVVNPKTFTARPTLADMEVGEIAYGIGTGPAGEDEIFFKPDATRISYWTASGIITA